MAIRRRMLNPEIWGDPTFNEIGVTARLLFIGMISHADDEGYLRADAKNLKRAVFGGDNFSVGRVDSFIAEVKGFSNIHFYESKGEQYAHFTKWADYQTIREDRKINTIYPPCPLCPRYGNQASTTAQPSAAEVKGREVKGSKDNGFERFWGIYKKKVAKKKAEQAWNKVPPSEHEKIYQDVERKNKSPDWLKDGGKYIPYPATYLNGERWKDEIGSSPPPPIPRKCRQCGTTDGAKGWMNVGGGIVCMPCYEKPPDRGKLNGLKVGIVKEVGR